MTQKETLRSILTSWLLCRQNNSRALAHQQAIQGCLRIGEYLCLLHSAESFLLPCESWSPSSSDMIARRMCANCMAECQGSRSINSLFLHKSLQHLPMRLQAPKVADDLNPCFYRHEAGNLGGPPVGFVQTLRQP